MLYMVRENSAYKLNFTHLKREKKKKKENREIQLITFYVQIDGIFQDKME